MAGTTQQGKDQTANPKGQASGPGKRRTKPAGAGRRPVDDKTRERIRKLAAEGLSRNAIARECKVSPSTVSRLLPAGTFDRTATAAATEAKVQDLKAQRAELSRMAVSEIHRLFGLLDARHEVIHWDKEGVMHRGQIDRPTSGDVKNYATAIGILTDKHLALIRHDSDDRDLPAVDQWLAALMGGGKAS